MCFSAPVSFTAGTILSATGIIAIKNTTKKKYLAIASIPLLFGIQQLLEGLVWISLLSGLPLTNIIATYGFVFFSHILWPVFAPLSVFLIEPIKKEKNGCHSFYLSV